MLEKKLIKNAAPTLAGLKTGNLFTCPYCSKAQACSMLRALNTDFTKKGLRLTPLRFSDQRMLLYLYRPQRLKQDLADKKAGELLKNCGYCTKSAGDCVTQLRRRLAENEEFPHEIGLFLGYPPEDVCGFIENKAACAQCVGCWKVYGDVESAKRKFAQYEKCTRVYNDLFDQGKRSLQQLTVAG